MPDFNASVMLEIIETHQVNASMLVPTMIHGLLSSQESGSRDLTSMRTVMSGASFVPAELVKEVKRVFGCGVSIVFGQTELHGVITQTLLTDGEEDQSATIGLPLPHMEVRIVDVGSGEIVPVGRSGEIQARGYQTMNGYHNMPEETAAGLDPDGWLKTGDLGAMDERGYLRITGRIKDLIIRGGSNVYPLEVEQILNDHPNVAEAVVVGIPDKKWGEQVGAVVRLADPDTGIRAVELRAWCEERLSANKAPTRWYFTDEMPHTSSGKIQKFLLTEEIAKGTLREESSVRVGNLST